MKKIAFLITLSLLFVLPVQAQREQELASKCDLTKQQIQQYKKLDAERQKKFEQQH